MSDPLVPSRPPKVLVVDDDPSINEVMVASFRIIGNFDVIHAFDGAAGLELACNELPDIVVIDVRMPQLNGYQLVRALRGDPATAEIPILVISAMVQPRDQQIGMYSGADKYLLKPVDPFGLVRAVHETLSVSQAQRQARMQALADEAAGEKRG